MADQMRAFDTAVVEKRDHSIREFIDAARIDRLARLAVPRQIERPHAPMRGEIGMIEHPRIQVAAETVDQHGGRAAVADLQVAHGAPADLRLLRLRPRLALGGR